MRKWMAIAVAVIVALVALACGAYAQQRMGIGGGLVDNSLVYEIFAEGRLAGNIALRITFIYSPGPTFPTPTLPGILEASGLLALKLGPLLQPYIGGGPGIVVIGIQRYGITLPILFNGLVGICSTLGPLGIYGQIRYTGLLGIFGILSPTVGFYMEF